jgi:hypothetical protein
MIGSASVHLAQHVLEGLLDQTAAYIGTRATTYRSAVWEAKDAVKRATAELVRVTEEDR